MPFLQEHQNAVHGIANQVALLVINSDVRKRFTNNINRLCNMVEVYGQALQPYVKKLERIKKRIEKTERTPGTEVSLADECPPPEGWVHISSADNRFINVDTAVIYRPPEPVNPLLWFGFFGNATVQRPPTEEEKLMCDYFLLAAVHDQELQDPTDRPIFPQRYEGKWFRPEKFRYALWQHNRCPTKVFSDNYDYDPHQQQFSDNIYERKLKKAIASSKQSLTQYNQISNDKLEKLKRSLHQVRADCKKPESAETEPKTKPARHSIDFRSVHWFGTDYNFTPNQAAAVKILWKAWENETPDVGGDTLAVEVESDSRRARDIFKGHHAFGNMIRQGQTKGSYRLVEPDK